MDELEELQRQLEAVQIEPEGHKFSERNIVELMEKLIERENLELLHTMNGKEYLTAEHLGTEIMTELRKAGGRLNIIDLPNLLDVGAEHIQRQIEMLTKKDKRKLTTINDSLFTGSYLDSVVADISINLAEQGSIPIPEISTSHDLPLDYLKIKLSEWIDGGKLKGKMHGGIIYNDMYIAREKCKVRGYARATTRPAMLTQAAADLKMEEVLLLSLLEEIISSGEFKGKIQAGLIIPICFEKSQKKIVTSFFEQNQYVKYTFLTKIMINKPKDYINLLNLVGVHLATSFVYEGLISQVDSHIANALSSDTHLDLYQHVPSSFTEDDLKLLLQNCPSASKAIPFSHYVAGPKFIEICLESLKEVAAKYIIKMEEGKKHSSPTDKKSSPTGSKKPETSPGGKKKKKGKKDDDDEDDEDKKLDLGLNPDNVVDELKKAGKLIKDGLSEDDEFLTAFAEHAFPEIRELYEEAFKAYHKSKSQPKKFKIQDLEGEIQKEFEKLQIGVRSLEAIEKLIEKAISAEESKKIITTLTTHLIKKVGNPFMNYCVVQQLIYGGVNINEHIQGKQIPTLPTADKDKMLKILTKTLIPLFNVLNEYITARDIKGFYQHILENKTKMAISTKLLDKKTEKTLKGDLTKVHIECLANDQDDFKVVVYNALCLSWIDNGLVIGLPNEPWAIELMGRIGKITGKVDSGLLEMVDLVKKHAEYSKVDKEERTPEQVAFLNDYETGKDERTKEIRLLWKIEPSE